METFKINIFITFSLLCVCFIQVKTIQLNQSSSVKIFKLNGQKNLKNYKYFSREKRSTGAVEESDINDMINKQLIPEDVEMINSDNNKKTETYDIHDETCNICSKKSVVNIPIVIHKNVFGVIEKTETSYECCPGWKNTSTNCCTEPICSKECINGEVCVAPDTCECPKDKTCKAQIDSNMCESLKPCEHLCIDTDTSFLCLCKPGFILASDKVSCTSKEMENPDSIEARDIEKDIEITNAHRLNNMEKRIENNKKATNDLNTKIRQLIFANDILSTKIKNQETNTIKMEKRIESNEENIKMFMKFVNELWKNSKNLFKKDLADGSDENNFTDDNLF